MLLKILSEYLECVEQIPSLSFEIVNSMIEILKVCKSIFLNKNMYVSYLLFLGMEFKSMSISIRSRCYDSSKS